MGRGGLFYADSAEKYLAVMLTVCLNIFINIDIINHTTQKL